MRFTTAATALLATISCTSLFGKVFGSTPNFIVMQPDDLQFFEEWSPPAHFTSNGYSTSIPSAGLPNIERLRSGGVQMMQAYTASSVCGTSRFSTITGRYPSRSAYSRKKNWEEEVADVTIPKTKLMNIQTDPNGDDMTKGKDCTRNNLPALLRDNGYTTGFVGKWHLKKTDEDTYSYELMEETITNCGFDYAGAIYAENLFNTAMNADWEFTHNVEYVTSKAIEFIEDATSTSTPFFLYLNPTAPHDGGNVYDALTQYTCLDTPEGTLDSEPEITGMTDGGTTCAEYRQTVIDRANGVLTDEVLGSIWVDDGLGAVIQTLEDAGQLDNTFFLFQMDHGQEGKGTVWEPGNRLAQFIHFPNEIDADTTFDGMVSTVDIAPTILDYAGIGASATNYFKMDGQSWRSTLESQQAGDSSVAATWNDQRCLFFELDQDRAVRCGCLKYVEIFDTTTNSYTAGSTFGIDVDLQAIYNLCDSDGNYDTSVNHENQDKKDAAFSSWLTDFEDLMDCHLDRTRSYLEPDYDTICYLDASSATRRA